MPSAYDSDSSGIPYTSLRAKGRDNDRDSSDARSHQSSSTGDTCTTCERPISYVNRSSSLYSSLTPSRFTSRLEMRSSSVGKSAKKPLSTKLLKLFINFMLVLCNIFFLFGHCVAPIRAFKKRFKRQRARRFPEQLPSGPATYPTVSENQGFQCVLCDRLSRWEEYEEVM